MVTSVPIYTGTGAFLFHGSARRLLITQVGGGAYQMKTANTLLAIVPDIVEDHRRPIRPATQNGIIQLEGLKHSKTGGLMLRGV